MSNDNIYTKGPWSIASVANRSKYPRLTIGGQRTVCSVQIISAEDTANAKLIASAPDMLDLLKQIVEINSRSLYPDELSEALEETIANAKELISKINSPVS